MPRGNPFVFPCFMGWFVARLCMSATRCWSCRHGAEPGVFCLCLGLWSSELGLFGVLLWDRGGICSWKALELLEQGGHCEHLCFAYIGMQRGAKWPVLLLSRHLYGLFFVSFRLPRPLPALCRRDLCCSTALRHFQPPSLPGLSRAALAQEGPITLEPFIKCH